MDDENRYFVWRSTLPWDSVISKHFLGVMEDSNMFNDTLIIAKNLYHDEAVALKKLMNAGVDDE